MTFNQYQYERVPLTPIDPEISNIPDRLLKAESKEEFLELLKQADAFKRKLATMYNICYIRHTINTQDEFYSAENDYYDQNMPAAEQFSTRLSQAVMDSRFQELALKELGETYFLNARLAQKAFSPEIAEDMAEENRLQSEYQKLIASARIQFDGQTVNLSRLTPFKESPDREVRQRAWEAESKFMEENGEKLDEIFDKLVKTRTRMAKKLGFNSFTEVAYCRLKRASYGRKETDAFCEQVRREIVPLAAHLIKLQHDRNNIEDAMIWDRSLSFKEGNPRPQGTPEEIFEKGRKMYSELSPVTAEFIEFMLANGLFDVLSRDGKASGGYCTSIPDFQAPFVFANFNGTAGDVEVLTHECGHALNSYISLRKVKYIEQEEPSYDIAEIHSMGMEFMTYPFMGLFFGDKKDKFIYQHLASAIIFLPYGCMVDRFQHIVYDNPELTPQERHKEWLKLEEAYRPDIDYGNISYFAKGGWWQRQLHIYMHPFYYIDYCLAQSAAFMLYNIMRENYEAGWEKYIALVNKGAELTYTQLLAEMGLDSPFEEGALRRIVGPSYMELLKRNAQLAP